MEGGLSVLRQSAIGFAAVLAISMLFASCGSPAKAPTAPAPAQKAPPRYSQQQREDFEAFYGEVMRVMAVVDDALRTYQGTFQACGKGEMSIRDAHTRILQVRDQSQAAWKDMGALIRPPESLSEVHRTTLKQAVDVLRTSLYARWEAYEYALQLLETQDASHVDTVKKRMEESDSFMMQGLAKLANVKTDLEVEE